MKKSLIGLVLALSLSSLPAFSANSPKAGSSCNKKGITETYKGREFNCLKKGGKLVWSKGKVSNKEETVAYATPTPTAINSTKNTQSPSPAPCREFVSVESLFHSTSVNLGEPFKLKVSASSSCPIDLVNVNLVRFVNGDFVDSYEGDAKLISGNKYKGLWDYELLIGKTIDPGQLTVFLSFASCATSSDGTICTTARNYQEEICSPALSSRQCKSSSLLQLVRPIELVSGPEIRVSSFPKAGYAVGEALYCGITNSAAWDYKSDYRKSNVISILKWIFPNGESTVWDQKKANWGEGITSTGIRYRISSNIQSWSNLGGLPSLKLEILDSNGYATPLVSTSFLGKEFICRFEVRIENRAISQEAKIVLK